MALGGASNQFSKLNVTMIFLVAEETLKSKKKLKDAVITVTTTGREREKESIVNRGRTHRK